MWSINKLENSDLTGQGQSMWKLTKMYGSILSEFWPKWLRIKLKYLLIRKYTLTRTWKGQTVTFYEISTLQNHI